MQGASAAASSSAWYADPDALFRQLQQANSTIASLESKVSSVETAWAAREAEMQSAMQQQINQQAAQMQAVSAQVQAASQAATAQMQAASEKFAAVLNERDDHIRTLGQQFQAF